MLFLNKDNFSKAYDILGDKVSFIVNIKNPDCPKDPYSPNLTNIQKRAIIDECKNNIWYFFRFMYRVNGEQLYPTQPLIASIYLYDISKNVFLYGQRRVGMTTIIKGIYHYESVFRNNTAILNPHIREDLLSIINLMSIIDSELELFPKYISDYFAGQIQTLYDPLLIYDGVKWGYSDIILNAVTSNILKRSGEVRRVFLTAHSDSDNIDESRDFSNISKLDFDESMFIKDLCEIPFAHIYRVYYPASGF